MALFCIVYEINQNISRKSQFFHTTPAFDTPVKEGFRMMVVICGVTVARCLCYKLQNVGEKFNRASRTHQRHRQTDTQAGRQTDGIAMT